PRSAREVELYYEGFSNATLWPLYHDVVAPPVYSRVFWDAYRAVNERFARAAADVADPGAVVWIQDYHLQLVPMILRRLRPDLKIGFFLHIPFPPIELFCQLPCRSEPVEGLLAADLVGFQRPGLPSPLLQLCRRLPALLTHRNAICVGGRTLPVAAFPLSVDFAEFEQLARDPRVQDRAKE